MDCVLYKNVCDKYLRNAHHFDGIVSPIIMEFPLNDISEMEALNVTLSSRDLSVALVIPNLIQFITVRKILCFFYPYQCLFYANRLGGSADTRDCMYKLMRGMFTPQLLQSVTWKRRTRDRRRMFGHLVNIIAVLGGMKVLSNFAIREEPF